jgi:hypothetical protein
MNPKDLISLPQATSLVPSRPDRKPVHVNTLFRWCLQGVRGVKLQSVLVGGQRFTTRAWLDDFLTALNQPEPERGGKG